MKAWAKSFYLSAAWEKTRAAYLMSQDYICERCGQPAKIVHHKRWLNRENINDKFSRVGGSLSALYFFAIFLEIYTKVLTIYRKRYIIKSWKGDKNK